jgi:hypothetical protein
VVRLADCALLGRLYASALVKLPFLPYTAAAAAAAAAAASFREDTTKVVQFVKRVEGLLLSIAEDASSEASCNPRNVKASDRVPPPAWVKVCA